MSLVQQYNILAQARAKEADFTSVTGAAAGAISKTARSYMQSLDDDLKKDHEAIQKDEEKLERLSENLQSGLVLDDIQDISKRREEISRGKRRPFIGREKKLDFDNQLNNIDKEVKNLESTIKTVSSMIEEYSSADIQSIIDELPAAHKEAWTKIGKGNFKNILTKGQNEQGESEYYITVDGEKIPLPEFKLGVSSPGEKAKALEVYENIRKTLYNAGKANLKKGAQELNNTLQQDAYGKLAALRKTNILGYRSLMTTDHQMGLGTWAENKAVELAGEGASEEKIAKKLDEVKVNIRNGDYDDEYQVETYESLTQTAFKDGLAERVFTEPKTSPLGSDTQRFEAAEFTNTFKNFFEQPTANRINLSGGNTARVVGDKNVPLEQLRFNVYDKNQMPIVEKTVPNPDYDEKDPNSQAELNVYLTYSIDDIISLAGDPEFNYYGYLKNIKNPKK